MNFDACLDNGSVKKATPDPQRARSILGMVEERQKMLPLYTSVSLKTEAYYEIIKECITSLLECDGYKSYSHECLISYLEAKRHGILTDAQLILLDDLRKIRHDIAYRGKKAPEDYLKRNENHLKKMISTLLKTAKEHIGK